MLIPPCRMQRKASAAVMTLSLIHIFKIQIKHSGDFSRILHAQMHQVLILLRRDRLGLRIQRDEFAGAALRVF